MLENIHFLILEDDRLQQNSLRRQLRELGAQKVYSAKDCTEARDYLTGRHRVDFAVLDVQLEGSKEDGIDFGYWLKDNYPIPTLFLSSYDGEELIDRTQFLPDSTYLLKPVRVNMLRVAVQQLLLRYQLRACDTQNLNLVNSDFFLIKPSGEPLTRIDKCDLLYLEARDKGTYFYTTKAVYFTRIPLRDSIAQLSALRICQVHQSFAFPVHALHRCTEEQVFLTSGDALNITKKYRGRVGKLLRSVILQR